MARKGKAGVQGGASIKLGVDIDAEVHRRLSVLAALQGRTLADVVREALAPVAQRVRMPSTPTTGSSFGVHAGDADAPAA